MFVTFEGTEGSGKSTALRAVADALRTKGLVVVCTREPGAGDLGARVREALLHGDSLSAKAELFLFLADRAEHVEKIVQPALARGEIVLCDRHADSTVAYQGHARGLSIELLRELNTYATGGLKPDLTLLFDIEPSIGLSRLADKDRIDAEPVEFHERVRAGFLAERDADPGRWRVLDASQPADALASQALSQIEALVPQGC